MGHLIYIKFHLISERIPFQVDLIEKGKKSFIYLDALNNLSDEFKWNKLNQDFERKENLSAKREFRQRFLDKLDLDYKDNGNNAFVFWK